MPNKPFPAGRTVACVSAPAAPPRVPSAPTAWIVVVVIAAFALPTVLGVPQSVALAGIASAGALGLRLAPRPVQVAVGGPRV